LNRWSRGWSPGITGRGACIAGILILASFSCCGCRNKEQSGSSTLLERISRARHPNEAPKPGVLAEKGRGEIVTACATQSYENARKGLIVSETGLHEDVFALRDSLSYSEIAYTLDEGLRLVSSLQVESNGTGHSTDQSSCIAEFAEYLETLTDPLLEADKRLKELDISAFEDSTRRAQEQLDRKPVEPATPVATPPAQPQ
jgi:hypothetical protein